MKQTAVDWLIEYCDREIGSIPNNIIEKAKEIEKEQIIDAYAQGFIESETMDKGAELYYQETFKNK